MDLALVSGRVNIDDLMTLISRRLEVSSDSVLPYAESTDFITEIFKTCDHSECRITGAGYILPEIAIAADRAEVDLTEVLGDSPFSSAVDRILADVKSPRQIIYVANPGRMSGAHFSLEELKLMASAVTEGLLVVDEYYFDHFGITAIPMLKDFENVVVLRSFTSAFGITSSDAGYAIASPAMISRIKPHLSPDNLSLTIRKTILASLNNDDSLDKHLKEIHDESLRLAVELSRLKVQCRMTASDFLLIRVADTKAVGNFLARCKVPIENLDGYPLMKNYVRYQIQSANSNDTMLGAFKKMPVEYYQMNTKDLRPVTLRKPGKSGDAKSAAGSRMDEKKINETGYPGTPPTARKRTENTTKK